MIRTLAWCGTIRSTSSCVQPALPDSGEGRGCEGPRREPVGLLALHPDLVLAAGDRLGRRRALRPAGGQPDHVGALGLGRELDAHRRHGLVGRGQHDRSRAVAEQDAGAPVGVVEEPGQQLRADDERVLREPGLDVGGRGRVAVHEARAGGHHVERERLRVADRLLDQGRGRRHPVVGREGREDDHVDVVGLEARGVDRPQAGHGAHRRRRLVRGRDAPLADPGPADDPLVGRVDHPLEVGVRQDLARARSGPSR